MVEDGQSSRPRLQASVRACAGSLEVGLARGDPSFRALAGLGARCWHPSCPVHVAGHGDGMIL